DPLAVAHETVPPAWTLLVGRAILPGRVCARGERVADEDGVRAVLVQLAERLVLNRERRNRLTVREVKSLLQHELLRRRGDKRVLQELGHGLIGEDVTPDARVSTGPRRCVAPRRSSRFAPRSCRLGFGRCVEIARRIPTC